MNLLENEEYNQKRAKSKKIMIIIMVCIVILLVISGVLLYMIYSVQKETLKLSVDNKSVNFTEDMFVIEDDQIYINIKSFAELMGYETYNGDYKAGKYSEDTTNCYIQNQNEIASYSLNSSTMYKKVHANGDYEYFELEAPVKLINEKLYVLKEGMEIGTNSAIQYNENNNQISVLSLDYIVNYYASRYQNSAIADEKADFNNKKALRYELIVVQNADKHFGVYNAKGQEIIGTKYTSIKFKEDSKEFTVTTDEGKMGILSADGITKIEPNYNEIKQISQDLNYYLVKNNEKYGVINQNGNIVIYLEYDQIGIDESKFNTNDIDNPYILFDNCIPVKQNEKWGIFDVNGKNIVPVQYDDIGCINGTQANKISNNVVIIPQYEGIVIGKEEKYAIVSSLGEQYVPMILDSVYSITTSGEDKYYMTFTRKVQENGELVEKQETYDLDQYFKEHVVNEPDEQQINENIVNTNTQNDTTNTNIIANAA